MAPNAHLFIRPDWRRWVTPGSELYSVYELYESKYSPDQPRVPAGSREGGQWTADGRNSGGAVSVPAPGGTEPTTGSGRSDPRVLSDATPDNYYRPGTRLAQSEDSNRVDLREEDQRGGHTISEHVAKSDTFLLSRVRREAQDAERRGWADGLRTGSFTSLESANKLVNSTLADSSNKTVVDSVASGASRYDTVKKEFGSLTGYEAYARNEHSQAYIRDTTGVAVWIVHDSSSEKGYRVHTAYPVNIDR